MPRKPMDYSHTVIYKIACRDFTVKDIYVGSTTDFRSRKSSHKGFCNNQDRNRLHYDLKVYQFIRAHGGWDNWDVIWIEDYPCSSSHEKRAREWYWMEQLKASLNTSCPIAGVNLSELQKQWEMVLVF